MSSKNSWLIQIALGILGIGLMGWMASRTLHFVELTVPADQKFMGYLFLLATGGGSIIWGAVYLGLASGKKQRGISFALGIIDLIGELGLAYADSMYVSSANGLSVKMTADDMGMFVLLSVGMVFINIIGVYFYHLFDPTAEQEQHAQDLVDSVTAEAVKNLNMPDVRAQMIAQHRPQIEAAIMASVAAQIGASVGKLMQPQIIEGVSSPMSERADPSPTDPKHPFTLKQQEVQTPPLSEVGGKADPFQGD